MLILLFLTGGGYYFWTTREITQPTTDPITQPNPPVKQPPKPAFSSDTPNYLPLSTEGNTPEGMKTLHQRTGKEVIASGITQPVEFFLADQNNTRLSLTAFLSQSGITLPESVTTTLSSDFSLFMINDQGQARIALAAISTNPEATKTALQQTETNLFQILSPLLPTTTTPATNDSFKEANYRGLSVRFLNFNPEQKLSIDYTLIKNKLIIATSKDGGRALMEKLLQ